MDGTSQDLTHQFILGQKVKSQGHWVTKCNMVIELCTLSSAQPPVNFIFRAGNSSHPALRPIQISPMCIYLTVNWSQTKPRLILLTAANYNKLHINRQWCKPVIFVVGECFAKHCNSLHHSLMAEFCVSFINILQQSTQHNRNSISI